MSWEDDIRGIRLAGEVDGHAFGMTVTVPDFSGDAIDRFYMLIPLENGTLTSGFALEKPVRWLSLPVGTTDSSATVDDAYRLRMTRLDDSEWLIEIVPGDSGQTVRENFTSGRFHLRASSPAPPFERLALQFEIRNKRGELVGDVSLRRE